MIRARSLKRTTVAAAVVVAGALLSGCSGQPGSAAVVNGTSISASAVDGAAAALCSAQTDGGQATEALASRGARQAAVQFLIDGELSRQYAEKEGVEPDQEEVSATLQQNQATIDALPQDVKQDFEDLLVGFRESELILSQVGITSLQEQGAEAPTPEEATAEGARLRAEWAAPLTVEVDPRFGIYAKGSLRPASGSVSIAVSERARAGAAADPGADWIASLPASQKCG